MLQNAFDNESFLKDEYQIWSGDNVDVVLYADDAAKNGIVDFLTRIFPFGMSNSEKIIISCSNMTCSDQLQALSELKL